jgi:hypothetical protein
MEVRGGKAGSEADPVRAARNAAAQPDIQPLGGPHRRSTSSRLGPEVCSASGTHWDRSSVPGGSTDLHATTGAPAVKISHCTPTARLLTKS